MINKKYVLFSSDEENKTVYEFFINAENKLFFADTDENHCSYITLSRSELLEFIVKLKLLFAEMG